jgi:hypothetical protein
MKTIRDLLSRDLSEKIEEVIKVDQQDEKTVYGEITEYVATDRIKRQYLDVLKAIADAPSDPSEGIGVWVSGFFGSGKSSFAKNLGYILANGKLLGHPAGQLFIQQLERQSPADPVVTRIRDTVDFINKRFDTHVIMFDVQVDRAVRKATEPIAEIMYTVLLRELDYAEDYDVAELEIEMEGEGRLGEFVSICARLFGDQTNGIGPSRGVPCTLSGVSPEAYAVWSRIRKGAQRIQRASAALHDLDPATYPTPDSWATSLRGKEGEFTIRTLVDRTFELTARRRPKHAVVFIIDEVGQYVARSADKIENLRAVVEHFGQESKNRVTARKAVAPVWVIVTSQEKLEEVVAAIDDKRVEIAKLQDRFKTRIDMAPADIREVATRRVLPKKPGAETVLRKLFADTSAMLNTHARMERTARQADITPDEFVQFYPYLPHFIDLSIDIVHGIRLEGTTRHIGGSNRTIIKQAYEMLVSDRTALADKPVGTLVSLDLIFDLIEGNLSSERQKDITDIMQRWPGDPWPARTAKAIALLEPVRDLPRTDVNLAALLYRRLGDGPAIPDVQRALKLLLDSQFIRQTESGWKLQTAREKSWTAERNAYNPNPRERNEILEGALQTIFSDPSLTRYRYHNMRNFRVGVSWDGRTITAGEAHVPLALRVADGPDAFASVCEQAQSDSRAESHRNDIIWATSLTSEIDGMVAEIFRSKQMVSKYEQFRSQNKLNAEEQTALGNEKSEAQRLEERLKNLVESALADGHGFFRGVSKQGAALGNTPSGILKALFDFAVPDLYPKLELGARPLKGDEAVEVLKAANLNGLSKVFYGPPDGLDLVKGEGSKYVVNLGAAIIKEVADYLAREHSYGNRVTGKVLENHFGGIGYGWEGEMLWLVLATLLRGGAIEVTYQGRRYRNHLDPQVRVPFSGANAFRSSAFAPRKAIDLPTLVRAAQQYEALTGEDVDVEETTLAQAFQALARRELDALLPVQATVRAHAIPVSQVLQEYHTTLDSILSSPSDDCVNMLAGEGATFQKTRDQVAAIRKATDTKGLARLSRMRAAVQQIWPALKDEGADGKLEDSVSLLKKHLDEGTYYQSPAEVDAALGAVEGSYRSRYEERHGQRAAAFEKAIDDVKAQPNWVQVPAEMQDSLLRTLVEKTGHELDLPRGGVVCSVCHASLSEMASDLAAVNELRSSVLLRAQELTTPEEKVERLRISDVVGVGQSLTSPEDVDRLLAQLRDHLLKLIASGVKVLLE